MRMLAAAAVALVSIAAGDAMPLAVDKLVTGPSSRVTLKNTGDRAVTAWSVAISTKNANGGIHRVFQTSDAYLAEVTRGLPRAPQHLDWIRAGQTRDVPVDPQPADATAEVFAVVLEDATAMGDPQTIATIFERRAAERDSLARVVAAFHDVMGSTPGTPAALQELKRRFAAGAGSAAEPTPERSAREAVAEFLRQASQNEDQAAQALRQYAAFVERQHDLAVKHAQRKSE
jgi:hypothetical protein